MDNAATKLKKKNFDCIVANSPNKNEGFGYDTNKIAISSGSACSSGKVKTSHVLKAMGITDDIAKCAIRVSVSFKTTKSSKIQRFFNK